MEITYKISEKEMKDIIGKYMKENCNMKNPQVVFKKEMRPGYGLTENEEYEVFIAQITEY